MNQAEEGCTKPLDLAQSNVIPRRKMQGEVCGQNDRIRDDWGIIQQVDRACTRWLFKRGLL